MGAWERGSVGAWERGSVGALEQLLSPVEITDPDDPRLDDFRALGDAELLRRRGLFMAEGRLVVRRLLEDSPYRTRAVLLTASAAAALDDVLPRTGAPPVYVAPGAIMEPLTGFTIHRGCLATGERPADTGVATLLARRHHRLLVMEAVSNLDNIGGLFRTAAAFDVRAVVLDHASADPLYRKAIRVSSGAALLVPFARSPIPDVAVKLRGAGYAIIALTPDSRAEKLAAVRQRLPAGQPLALMVGNEGSGLSDASLSAADARVQIPINRVIDSLNVTVAAGIALHALR
jgi:tRNA G18 (ribose-2'-O)-methylase SpoU